MKTFVKSAFVLALAAIPATAQPNMGDQKPESALPFVMNQVTTFNLPWRMAFLPDGRMLVTEKVGPIWLVTDKGMKTAVLNVPAAQYSNQNGMLGIYVSPTYAADQSVYLTYSEPGTLGGIAGSSLALAKAKLAFSKNANNQDVASLENLQVIWRDGARGRGGQFGAAVAFSPDNKFLFLSVGERQRFTPAQDPNQPLGKIQRLTLDGKPAPGNPNAGKTGAASVGIINPPADTEAAKTAPIAYTYNFPGPNLTPSETWTSGHRTPYAMAFGPDGRLWEVEHGPRGGDELNLIEPGKNYGWPNVAYATNYNGKPIPSHDTNPAGITKPVIYWNPVIAVGNIAFYKGNMFPQWNGSALVSGMVSRSLTRITFDGKGGAKAAERFDMGKRIRDVAVAPDGAIWLLEDSSTGGMFRVTPKPAQ
jgi:glucose/arabinose dehydrogenase